jgi:hypothetical protein
LLGTNLQPLYVSGTIREMDGFSNPISNLNCTLELWKEEENSSQNTLLYSAEVSGSFTQAINNLSQPLSAGNYIVEVEPYVENPNYCYVECHFSVFPLIQNYDNARPTVNITNQGPVNFGVVWVNGTYNDTGGSVMRITIDDKRFSLVDPSPSTEPPYGNSGTFSFRATGIQTGIFDVKVSVEDVERNVETVKSCIVVVATEAPIINILYPVYYGAGVSSYNTYLKTDNISIEGTYNAPGDVISRIFINDTRFALIAPIDSLNYSSSGTFCFENLKPIEVDKNTLAFPITLKIYVVGENGNYSRILVNIYVVNPDFQDIQQDRSFWIDVWRAFNGDYSGITGSIMEDLGIPSVCNYLYWQERQNEANQVKLIADIAFVALDVAVAIFAPEALVPVAGATIAFING